MPNSKTLLAAMTEPWAATQGAILTYTMDRDLRYLTFENIGTPDIAGKTESPRGITLREACEFRQIDPEDIADIERLHQLVLDDQRSVRQVIRTRTPDKTYYFDLNLDPVCDANGNCTGLRAASFDLTDSPLIREDLDDELMREHLMSTPLLLYMQDRDLRFTWVGNRTAEYEGMSLIGVDEREIYDNVSASDRTEWLTIKERVVASGEPYRGVIRLTTNGKPYYFHQSLDPIFNEEGEVVGLRGSGMDVTGTALADAWEEQRTYQAIDKPLVVYFSLNADLVFTAWNAHPPGLDNSESKIGKPITELISEANVLPMDAKAAMTMITTCMETGKHIRDIIRVSRPDVPTMYIDLTLDPIWVGGEVQGVVGKIFDVTDSPAAKTWRMPAQVSDFKPTYEHIQLLDEVRELVGKWKPRLPWLANWHVVPMPCAPNDEDWGMQIMAAGYVHGAQLLIKEHPITEEGSHLFPEGEYSIELLVLHELVHLAFDRLRTQAANIATQLDGHIPVSAVSVIETEEEIVAWKIARALIYLEHERQQLVTELERATNECDDMRTRLDHFTIKEVVKDAVAEQISNGTLVVNGGR